MVDLITLDELKVARGIDPTDVRDDGMLSSVIPLASAVIRQFTERDFGAPIVTETRTFEYDDSGYLDIDDAQTITGVSLVIPSATNIVLDTDEWRAMPAKRDDSLTYWYILMPSWASPGASPELGFKRNLDVAYREGRYRALPQLVDVTATWGWPAVPEDVKLAAVWTIEDWLAGGGGTGGEDLTSESIADFSRTWGGRGTSAERQRLAIPSRSLSILANYEKITV